MGTQDPAENPLSPEAQLAAAKASFEAAKRKTALQAGAVAEPEAPEEEPKAEAAAEEKPAPKPKKPKAKPVEAPKPDPMETVTAQLRALEEKISALSAPKAPEPEPEEDDDAEYEKIRADLVEKFGEDEGSTLYKAMLAREARAEKRVAQLEKIIQDAQTYGRKTTADQNRKRLVATYPALADDEVWEMVSGMVQAGFGKKKHASVEDAYDQIVTKMYGGMTVAAEADEEPSEEDEEQASRIAASAMTQPRKAGGRENRSRVDKMREHFEFIKKHPEDKAGAKRLARELGIDR